MDIATSNFSSLLPKVLFKSIKILPSFTRTDEGAVTEKRDPDKTQLAQTQRTHQRRGGSSTQIVIDLSIQTTNPSQLLPYNLFLAVATNESDLRQLQQYESYTKEEIIGTVADSRLFKKILNVNNNPNAFICQKALNSGPNSKVYVQNIQRTLTFDSQRDLSYLALYCGPYQVAAANEQTKNRAAVLNKNFLLGDCVSELCLKKGLVPPLSLVYTFTNSGPWGKAGQAYVGDVYRDSAGRFRAAPAVGASNTKTGLVKRQRTPNQKVKDLRFMVDSGIGSRSSVPKQNTPAARLAKDVTRNNYFSDFYFSTNERGNNRIFFNFNFNNFVSNNSSLSSVMTNSAFLRKCFILEDIEVYRKPTSENTQSNGFTGVITALQVSSADIREVKVGSLAAGNVKVSDNVGPDLLSVVACDNTLIGDNISTQFQEYELKFHVLDNSAVALSELVTRLEKHLAAYEGYINKFIGHGRKTGQCMDTYIRSNINLLKADSSWKALVDTYLGILEVLGASRYFGKYRREYWQRNLYSLANPYSASQEDVLTLERFIATFLTELKGLISKSTVMGGTQDHLDHGKSARAKETLVRRISYNHRIGKKYKRVQDPGVGLNYLNPAVTIENPGGLTNISFDNFKKRIQQEASKFSVRNIGTVNQYGYLTPWALQTTNERLQNDGTNFNQTWSYLATIFDSGKRSPRGSPHYDFGNGQTTAEAAENLMHLASISVTKNKVGTSRNLETQIIKGQENSEYREKLLAARGAEKDKNLAVGTEAGNQEFEIQMEEAREAEKASSKATVSVELADASQYVGETSDFVNQTSETGLGNEISQTEQISLQEDAQTDPSSLVVTNIINQMGISSFNSVQAFNIDVQTEIATSYQAQQIIEDPVAFATLTMHGSLSTVSTGLRGEVITGNDSTLVGEVISTHGTLTGQVSTGLTGELVIDASDRGAGGALSRPVPCSDELELSCTDSPLFNPFYVDMNYNSIVRLEFLIPSRRGINERWTILSEGAFNTARNTGRSLIVRMVNIGALTTGGGIYRTGLDTLNQIFVIGPTLVPVPFSLVAYLSTLNSLIQEIGQRKTATDVRSVIASLESEYLCSSLMRYKKRKFIATDRAGSHHGAGRNTPQRRFPRLPDRRNKRRAVSRRLENGQELPLSSNRGGSTNMGSGGGGRY